MIVLFIERDDLQACSAELSARLATRPLAFLVVMCAPGVTLEEVRATSSDVLSHRVAHVLEHEPHLPHAPRAEATEQAIGSELRRRPAHDVTKPCSAGSRKTARYMPRLTPNQSSPPMATAIRLETSASGMK